MERAIPLLRRLLLRRRTRYSLMIALTIIVALAIAALLRKAAPPEVARLLPESDAIVYLDLKPIRAATHFDRQWAKNPVEHAPDYQHFLDATGIVPERDLDQAALAIHRMPDPNGPNGPVAYSEVFEGRFDSQRLAQYLSSVAVAQESYAGHTVYTIQAEPATKTTAARYLRIAQLGYDTIAASNMPTTEQIHSMLDRYSASASPFSGSSLLNARYREVPLLSSAWAIGRIGLPLSQDGQIQLFGVGLPVPADTTFVASLRFVGSLHLRIEEIAPSDADAEKSAGSLNAILTLVKGFTQPPPNTTQPAADADLHKLLDSLAIKQESDRVVITGSVPLNILQQASAAGSK